MTSDPSALSCSSPAILPPELWEKVLHGVSLQDLIHTCRFVCIDWSQKIGSKSFWLHENRRLCALKSASWRVLAMAARGKFGVNLVDDNCKWRMLQTGREPDQDWKMGQIEENELKKQLGNENDFDSFYENIFSHKKSSTEKHKMLCLMEASFYSCFMDLTLDLRRLGIFPRLMTECKVSFRLREASIQSQELQSEPVYELHLAILDAKETEIGGQSRRLAGTNDLRNWAWRQLGDVQVPSDARFVRVAHGGMEVAMAAMQLVAFVEID